MPTVIDLTDPIDVLRDAAEALTREIQRLESIARLEGEFNALAENAATAIKRNPGDPWEEPANALFAYAKGAIVTHSGSRWISLIDSNVWAPGVAGWRVQSTGDQPAEWVQPAGAFDAYGLGDRVERDGQVYVSRIDANVWPPDVAVAWELAAPAQGVLEWKQPTGAHDAYNSGDRVLFEGATYESLIDGNVHSPLEYPPGWKKLAA